MKFIKFLIAHPAFIFYFAVMIAACVCLYLEFDTFLMAPLIVKIGILLTIIGGSGGMGYLLVTEYKVK